MTYAEPSGAIEPSTVALRAGAQAQLARDGACQRRFRLRPHQRERRLDLTVWQQRHERRLLKLHRHGLLQRIVEDGIAGRVREVGDDDDVAFGEGGRPSRSSTTRSRRRRARRPQARPPTPNERASEWARSSPCRWPPRRAPACRLVAPAVAVATGALPLGTRRASVSRRRRRELGDEIAGGLVAELRILLERARDDAIELHRRVGIQLTGRGRLAVEDGVVHDGRRLAPQTPAGPSPSRAAPGQARTDRCGRRCPRPRACSGDM